MQNISPPLAAKYSLDRAIFLSILRSKIDKKMALSKYNLAIRAKFRFETEVFFMILLRKIMKNTSVSKKYAAAAGGKILFTQPEDYVGLCQKHTL